MLKIHSYKKLSLLFALVLLSLVSFSWSPTPARAALSDDVDGCVFEYKVGVADDSPGDEYTFVKDGQYLFIEVTTECDAFNSGTVFHYDESGDNFVNFSAGSSSSPIDADNNGDVSRSEANTLTLYAFGGAEEAEISIASGSRAVSFFETGGNVPAEEVDEEEIPQEEEVTEENPKTCEDQGGALGWIVCPVIEFTGDGLSWLDTQIEGLLEVDSNKYNNDGIKGSWSIIRNLAYIILVPIMLVMVISTALGFEFVSAYTVKRALPRLIAAALFISISYTFCVFLIEFSNNVGAGAKGIITAPFRETIGVDELTLASLFETDSVGGWFDGIIGSMALVIGAVVIIWLFLAPLLMLAATALLILLARQVFLVAFLLLAPLAILAWIFPGNDKLWKMWWGSFSKLLMMFPLIMVIIGVGRIFAFVILPPETDLSGGFQGAIIEPLMAIAVYILPYAAIPFTFKLAGGIFGTITGMAQDREKGFFDKQRQNRAAKLERKGRTVLQKRANIARGLETAGSKGNWVKRHGAGYLARRVGGYNVEAAMSARNAQVSKEINDQIATGKDDDIRGLTAAHSYDYAKKNGLKQAVAAGYAKVGEDGTVQYKTLGGAMVSEANVIAGRKRWGNDRFAQQAALGYEMRKAMKDEDVSGLATDYHKAAASWGMSDSEAAGAWIGSAFENQNQHIEYKGMDWQDGSLKGGGKAFVDEVYEKKGSYPLSQMSAHTIKQLENSYETSKVEDFLPSGVTMQTAKASELAEAQGDYNLHRDKIKQIAETFVMRGGEIEGMAEEGGQEVPIVGGQRVAGPPVARSQGAAAVDSAVKRLASLTGAIPSGQRQQGGSQSAPGAASPVAPPAPGTRRDDQGNTRQSGGPGAGGVHLG